MVLCIDDHLRDATDVEVPVESVEAVVEMILDVAGWPTPVLIRK